MKTGVVGATDDGIDGTVITFDGLMVTIAPVGTNVGTFS
jgi:hypothetical protein